MDKLYHSLTKAYDDNVTGNKRFISLIYKRNPMKPDDLGTITLSYKDKDKDNVDYNYSRYVNYVEYVDIEFTKEDFSTVSPCVIVEKFLKDKRIYFVLNKSKDYYNEVYKYTMRSPDTKVGPFNIDQKVYYVDKSTLLLVEGDVKSMTSQKYNNHTTLVTLSVFDGVNWNMNTIDIREIFTRIEDYPTQRVITEFNKINGKI